MHGKIFSLRTRRKQLRSCYMSHEYQWKVFLVWDTELHCWIKIEKNSLVCNILPPPKNVFRSGTTDGVGDRESGCRNGPAADREARLGKEAVCGKENHFTGVSQAFHSTRVITAGTPKWFQCPSVPEREPSHSPSQLHQWGNLQHAQIIQQSMVLQSLLSTN